jgi:hypothetical protein
MDFDLGASGDAPIPEELPLLSLLENNHLNKAYLD